MDHVVILAPELMSAEGGRPKLTVAVEARDRPGPAYKHGVYNDDVVWIRMGPLLVAKATVKIAWKGEYAFLRELEQRLKGTELEGQDAFWTGKPKIGYAVVAQLQRPKFLDEASLAGPRSYGYDWIVLESDKKRDTWLTRRPPEPKDEELLDRFAQLKGS